jgi:hypothetical protein
MTLATIFAVTTLQLGLPQGLLSSICYVETKHQPGIVKQEPKGGESLGVCQIKVSTARLLGYHGTDNKLRTNSKVNIYYAGKYLKKQLRRYDGEIWQAVAAYNAGSYHEAKGGILPCNRKYQANVFSAWIAGR